jgi:acetyl-CoA decarbonylase/synthase complex subunit alpha
VIEVSSKKEAESRSSTVDFQFSGVQVHIGDLIEEWEEPEGPTPFPGIKDLRTWDFALLKRYNPFYMPFCDMCCLCTMGKCDMYNKKGACGLQIDAQSARIVTLACCMGAAAHTAHARHLLELLIEKKGSNYPIDLGGQITIKTPLTILITGIKPTKLGDFRKVLDYCEEQIVHVLSATNMGQEGNYLDMESKALHVGMIDILALEVADIVQIISLGFPKGDPTSPLVEIGIGAINRDKPVILLIGHNVAAGTGIADYLDKENLYDKVELVGICCTSHDITRYEKRAKIVGPLSMQLRFIKSGIADVIVVDEQCVRTDVLDLARLTDTPVIATSDKLCLGLPDLTMENPDKIVEQLNNGDLPGAFISDINCVGKVAAKLAQLRFPKRKNKKHAYLSLEVVELAKKCTQCQNCRRNCHNNIDIPTAMKLAKDGELSGLRDLFGKCVGCGKCESACPQKLPIIEMSLNAASELIKKQKSKIRAGRGPVQDVEIRNVGAPIVLGEIPGIVALVGCPNHDGGNANVRIAEEFLKRNFIVVASGCAAMDIALNSDLYEKYPGDFDRGCLVNVGSCVANSHIFGAAVKVANIFAHKKLRANYEEIADYILNRLGAVGVAWGAITQKAAAIATGANRLGIPVITGPVGSKYRRALLSNKTDESAWTVFNARSGEQVRIGPGPEHLLISVETLEEAIVLIAKLSIRPNDTSKGRQIKLSHYIDLSQKMLGKFPDDLDLFIRNEQDIPLSYRDTLLKELKAKGWKPRQIPDPTLLKRLIRKKR